MRAQSTRTHVHADVSNKRQISNPRRTVVTRATDLFTEDPIGSNLELIIVAVGTILGLGVGIGAPMFYTQKFKTADSTTNKQVCFSCSGSGSTDCRFCDGRGRTSMVLGSGEVEEQECINCSGKSYIACRRCNGTGIQPRFLDRREFVDDD